MSDHSFETDLTYHDRPSKARYVWSKYEPLLGKTRSLLDVGADQCYLKGLIPDTVAYTGVDISGHPDVIHVNLDQEPLPFERGQFEAVICLDVLEHLENIHTVFDELCRVSSRWLILSLPNPFASFMDYLISEGHKAGGALQHYGLPNEPVIDRHRWFYSASNALEFVAHRAETNGMKVLQMDGYREDPAPASPWSLEGLARLKQRWLMRRLFRSGGHVPDFEAKTIWWVLERPSGLSS